MKVNNSYFEDDVFKVDKTKWVEINLPFFVEEGLYNTNCKLYKYKDNYLITDIDNYQLYFYQPRNLYMSDSDKKNKNYSKVILIPNVNTDINIVLNSLII